MDLNKKKITIISQSPMALAIILLGYLFSSFVVAISAIYGIDLLAGGNATKNDKAYFNHGDSGYNTQKNETSEYGARGNATSEYGNDIEKETPPLNILVAGVDNNGVPDTVIIVKVSAADKSIQFMSLNTEKGMDGRLFTEPIINNDRKFEIVNLKSSVESLSGMTVDRYFIMNIATGKKIVDAIGGVNITVARPLKYEDKAQNLNIDIPAAKHLHLDGKTAMDYARYKDDVDGERGRLARQQYLISAVVKKIVSPQIIARLPSLVKVLMDDFLVYTDISIDEAYELSKACSGEMNKNLSFDTFRPNGERSNEDY